MSVGDSLPPLRDVIRTYDLRAKKSFGQNFLLDLNLTGKIARIASPLDECLVYEVGPGPGGLTRAILSNGANHLSVVEMDERCLPALRDIAEAFDQRLSINIGDALKINEHSIFKDTNDAPIKVIANLPYNVGTQLLIKWLTVETWKPWYQSLTLMFQKEVAERIVAKPGNKAYGRLSVLAQWRGRVSIALNVPASAFTPPPKVASAVIHYIPGEPIDANVRLRDIEKITERAFGQRRKMLRASLKGLDVDPISLLKAADIDETTRAEQVSVEGFVALAKSYRQLKAA